MHRMSLAAETLLVVEDDDDLRRMFEHVLVFEGFRVLAASNGAEALRLLNTHTPALVVLDLVLPWVNGIEVLATMRQDGRLRSVPVLVVTGTPTTKHDLQPYRPVTVMHKPVNADALAAVIHQLLAGSGS
jgi:CheY-like chemotaxis protein